MKTTLGKDISKVGIGSYGIGGRGHRDMPITEKNQDIRYIEALVYTLEQGINFTEIALGYGHGQSIALFKEALNKSSVQREEIFLTHSLYPRDLPSMKVVNEDIASFHKVMDTEYVDSTLVTQSLIIKFGEKPIYALLHDLLKTEKTRYVTLSNASPKWIKAFNKEFGDHFVAHEGHLSFEVRALQDKGVFSTCGDLGVTNIIWRPLGRSKTLSRNWKLLTELSAKYGKTQSQVILNWICKSGCHPMVFSTRKEHIDENIGAAEFEMEEGDYSRMKEFRPDNYRPPRVDWEGAGIDDGIVSLVKDFDLHQAADK